MYKTKIINARRILLDFEETPMELISDKEGILSIQNSEFDIKRGQKIFIDNKNYYIANEIIQQSKNKFICEEFKATKSLPFITPLICKNNDTAMYDKNLINTYIGLDTKSFNETSEVHLLYRKYLMSNEEINSLKNYFKEIGIFWSNDRFMVFSVIVDSKIKEDIKLFIGGGYSKISEESKQKIINFHKSIPGKLNVRKMLGILYRTNERKNELEKNICIKGTDKHDKEIKKMLEQIEYYSIPLISEETLWTENI